MDVSALTNVELTDPVQTSGVEIEALVDEVTKRLGSATSNIEIQRLNSISTALGHKIKLGRGADGALAVGDGTEELVGVFRYLAAAEPLYREAVEGLRETLGNRHQDTLTTINNLGVLLQSKGNHAAGEPLCLGVSLEALDRHRVHA